MKFRMIIFPLLLIVSNLCAQSDYETMDGPSLRIDGQSFTLKKEVILRKYGKPVRIFEPKYECGFLSEDGQGMKFFSLEYVDLKFTGNSKEGYLLEEIVFKPALKRNISFRHKPLSHQTTIPDFESIFGVKVSGSEKVIYNKGADDAYIFTFSKGKLLKIEYWSPC